MNQQPASDLFSRNGHLTMLTLDCFDAGELPTDSCERAVDHLRDCSICSARLHEVQAVVSIGPRHSVTPIRAAQNRATTGLAFAATLAAAAAALLIVAWPQAEQASRVTATDSALTASPYTTTTAPPDELGEPLGGIELRAYADDERLAAHERVSWDDAVSVEISAAVPGYVALLVVSERSNAFDEEGTGGAASDFEITVLLAPGLVSDPPTGRGPISYRADPLRNAATAAERLIAVSCPEPFSLETGTVSEDLEGIFAADGCSVASLSLTRTADAADS